MFRKAFSVASLLLLAGTMVLVTPGSSQAKHAGGGGFHRDFDHRFIDPRFGGFDPRFDRRFVDPRFDGRFIDPRFDRRF
jgi:hypothetical protein